MNLGQGALVSPGRLHEITYGLLGLTHVARRHTRIAVGLDQEVRELKCLALEGIPITPIAFAAGRPGANGATTALRE